MNWTDKLSNVSALKGAMSRARPVYADLPSGAEELTALLGAQPARNHYGKHLRIQNWFADPAQCPAPNGALDLLLPHTRDLAVCPDFGVGPGVARRKRASQQPDIPAGPSCAADPEKWLFLDTETTGLAGGSGTYAFLVGLAWWDAGGLHCEQLFLRDFTEEHSLLLALAERLAERPVLVTFNGKTFDWPLLETRYRMTRAIATPPLAAHLDLLHPARQLWRLRWGSVRLCELERNVLSCCTPRIGWTRDGDLRGDMIPQIYFDYLRGAQPAALLDVLRHNQMDLRGLAALAGRIITLLNTPESAEGDGYELFGVSRIVKQRAPREARKAHDLFALAVDAGLPEDLHRRARREMALLARRERNYERAAEIWESLTGESDLIALEAFEQLAIHCERRRRNPQRALEWVNQGMVELRALQRARDDNAAALARIRYRYYERIARLERKISAKPHLRLPIENADSSLGS